MARIRVGRQFLPTSWQTVRTVSSSLDVDFIEFTFCNTSGQARQVEVRFVPAGATAGNQHLVIDQGTSNALESGETRAYEFAPFLKPGDRVQWRASAASAVSGGVAINEATALTGGASRVRHDQQYVPNAAANLSPAVVSSKQITELEMAFCNQSSADRKVRLWAVTAGAGTIDDRFLLVDLQANNALGPGETVVYNFATFLQAGDYLRWDCDAANAVSAYISYVQE